MLYVEVYIAVSINNHSQLSALIF